MTTAFYDHISPKAVFFDAPNWLMNDETGKYDAWKMREYFEGRNVEIYTFQTGTNTIVLE